MRWLLVFVFLLPLAFTLRADSVVPITLGKYQVHPTRILAKRAAGVQLETARVSLDSLGLEIQRQFQIVPGLVVLEPGAAEKARLKVATEQTAADALLERIRALEATGQFEYVQPSYIYTNLLFPTDARFQDGTLWALRNTGRDGGVAGADIGAVRAWDLTTGSTNVIVAVVDSGIRYTHQELAAQMWHNQGEIPDNGLDDDQDGYADDVFGFNAITGFGDPFDDTDHGTHIAGTIGAAANDGHPHVGIAWNVQLMACKFIGQDGWGTTDDAMTCIEYAVAHGAKIINASFAGAPFEQAMYDMLASALRSGVLFVAAAGNSYSDNDADPTYPSSYRLDNVISVAAMDRDNRLADFSNYGRTSVHLAAPGVEIYSCSAESDGAYAIMSGTSMAAPHVTGVAALILAKYPNASIPEIRERLFSTVTPVPALADSIATGGRLNAYGALSAAPDGIMSVHYDPPEGSDLSARRPVTFYVTVTDLSSVTNAVVLARIAGTTNDIVFRNDGVSPDVQAQDGVYSGQLTLPTTPGPFDLQFSVTAPGKTNYAQTVTYVIASPPLNDNFADAFDLPPAGTAVVWTNRFATIEPGEPKHAKDPSAANSVWWNWTPNRSGSVIIDTAGSSFDTVLGVYTNNTLTSLKEVASADDAGTRKQGYAIFDAQAGVTYHIAIAGFSAPDAGEIHLRVVPGGAPDGTAPQIVITSPATGSVITNLTDAKVVVTGTALDPLPNATGVKQVQVQLNRDVASTATGTTNWTATVLLQEGVNRINVAASDYAGNLSSTYSVSVSYQPLISPNDLLTNAIELSGLSGSVQGNNSRAGKEPGEPLHAGNAGGHSIWWSYQPSTSGVLSLSTANSSFNTLLALYSSATGKMADMTLLANNDDAQAGVDFSKLTQALPGGTRYYIAVDGFNGSTGLVQLAYSFTPAAVHQLKVNGSQGGSAFPGSGYFEDGAAVTVAATSDPFYWFERWSGTFSSTENPITVLMTADTQLTPVFHAVEFSDGFETGDLHALRWTTAGNLPWVVQSDVVQAGRFAARSGPITAGQKTSLILTDVFRAGTATFAVRVSSEATWDVLDFYVNGKRLNRWSGEVPWSRYQFDMPAGTNTLEWRYSKDFLNTNQGLDAAFIDNLDLPLYVAPDRTTPARLNVQRFKTGAVQLNLFGQTNQLYRIEFCPDLTNWQPVYTGIARGGLIRFDTPPDPSVRGFYRATVP